MTPRRALVTGASGAIGSRLTTRLLDDGWVVRVMSRDASRLDGFSWSGDVEVVEGDASSKDDLDRATADVDVAWFLIHSMSDSQDYAEEDRRIARAFAAACLRSQVSRIVYLGGLLPDGELSEHLDSRREVGQTLLDSGVPTTVLQAGIVVGPGSVSYELLRRASVLPVVVAPTWVNHRVQPISLADALHYLVGAADVPADVSRAFDIGGSDTFTYSVADGRGGSASG
ncbi:MAG: NAD-dependent epimerase/dehydratase family protein, partial [Actinomycetales bacterium]